jgi:nitrate reductase gamma subunit
MTGFLLIIAYASILIFLFTFILKAMKYAKLPNHLRWELAPVPHEKGKSHYGGSYLEEFEWWTKPREKSLLNEVLYMFKEIVFLKGVYESNKKLWIFSFPFHFGMYLIIGMLFLILTKSVLFIAEINREFVIIENLINSLAAIGYTIGILGTIGLIISRVFDKKLNRFATGGTFFNLFFILFIFATGGYALINSSLFSNEMTLFTNSLLTADTSLAMPGIITLHGFSILLFMAYLPFTRMLHFVAKYFTYHDVRWNDEPLNENENMVEDVKKSLSQKVTWAAPHVNADGKKNWIDIATEVKSNEK